MAIGVKPVGTNFATAGQILTKEQLQGIEDVAGEGVNPNAEKVLSLSPDLILVPDFLEDKSLEALTKIAPTVAVSYTVDAFTRLQTIGDLHFSPPDTVRSLIDSEKSFRWKAIPPEALKDYAGDRVFLAVTNDEPALRASRDIMHSEHWLSLPAVRSGHAYVTEHKWGLYDPITLDGHLDEMARLLAT
ncbi:hypothetical protein [Paenibacillus sp. MBLB4367]|uniref:hypothetical protein n=1 Tax=Paenibacillus sp. MBLB4367 TaxID=3384767 RepID=UPI0039083097